MASPPAPPESNPSPPLTPPNPLHPIDPHTFNRLSLPFAYRLPGAAFTGSFLGFALGATHGSQETSLRFRAENAHRLPTTQAGWYLYHKSKNYHVILGGLYEGWRMSFRLGCWAALFVGLEEGMDRGRAAVVRGFRDRVHPELVLDVEVVDKGLVPRDFMSTVLAGLGTAGCFAAWNGFPMPTAVRVMKLGAKAGLGFGLVQDVVSLLRGRKLGYVEFVKRHTFGTDEGEVRGEKVEVGAG
jgi:hypothetical protein